MMTSKRMSKSELKTENQREVYSVRKLPINYFYNCTYTPSLDLARGVRVLSLYCKPLCRYCVGTIFKKM